jgi:ABC-type transport system involved in multi-copper enzyme maturation permease subunit
LIGFIANYGWHKDAAPMRFLPIVERELRLFVRRPRCYYARSLTAVIATCIAAGTIIVQLSGGALPSEIGANLFSTLSLLAFGFALLAGPFITADSLSSENREGTLGLLFLTHLRSHDIVIGKLVSTGLPALFWPLAIIPVMSFSFPLGGLPQPVFWRV